MSDSTIEQLVLQTLERLEIKVDHVATRTAAIETRQEGTRLELAGINQRLDIGNERMDVANGRTTKHELRLEALEVRNHDADLVALARQEQRQEVKRAAFSLLRAVDNKIVTFLVLIGLIGLGAIGQWVWPW